MAEVNNTKAIVEINSNALSMVLSELWDADNESVYPLCSFKMVIQRVLSIFYKDDDVESKKWMVYVKMLASPKYFMSEQSDEYDMRYYKYLHPVANLLFMLINVFDMEKVKAHYMDEMERIQDIIPEGAYIMRCDIIKKVITLFESIQKYYKDGLCVIASGVLTNEDNKQILNIYFGDVMDMVSPQNPV